MNFKKKIINILLSNSLSPNILLVIFIILFNYNSKVFSEEIPVIVISPSKTIQSYSVVGSTIETINLSSIENSDSNLFISDIISNNINGANIFRSGGQGTTSGIQLRGLPKRYTTVYIDGVKMSDPSSPDNSFYFSNLMKNSIDNIEILKGSQSSIYGSGAIGGAINIITKNARDKNINNLIINKGSNSTNNIELSFGNIIENYDYFFGLSNFNSEGISAMNDDPDNNDSDSYDNSSLNLNSGYIISDNLNIRSSLRYSDSFLNYDEVQSGRTDIYNSSKENELTYTIKLNYDDNYFNNSIIYNRTNIQRATKTYQNISKNYYGNRDAFNLISEYNFNLDTKLLFGFDNEFDRAKFQKDWPSNYLTSDEAIYSQYFDLQFRPIEKLFFTLGARRDDHTTAGDHYSERLTLAYKINNFSKFRSSFGTGIRFPSLYDYFYGTVVDKKEDLKPEKSKSLDFGYDSKFNSKNIDLSMTIFYIEYKDPLEGWSSNSWTIKNSNAKIKSKGFEFNSGWAFNEKIGIKFKYNYNDTYDGADCDNPDVLIGNCIDSAMVRVPRHSSSLEIKNKSFRYHNNLSIKYSGETRDYGNVNNNFIDVILDDFIIFDYNFTYNLDKKNILNFNVNNIFDQNYETAYMYSTLGRNINFTYKKSF